MYQTDFQAEIHYKANFVERMQVLLLNIQMYQIVCRQANFLFLG